MSLLLGYHVFLQGRGDAVPLGFLRGGQNRGIVPAVGIVKDLPAHFYAHKPLHLGRIAVCKLPDGPNPRPLQLFGGGGPYSKQFPHRKGPHFP